VTKRGSRVGDMGWRGETSRNLEGNVTMLAAIGFGVRKPEGINVM